MSERDLIVVDIETTGLDYSSKILEVAAINVSTGKTLYFAPHIDDHDLHGADPEALRINRYYERGVFRHTAHPYDTQTKFSQLRAMLYGNTLGGSNPTFDADHIARATTNIAQCTKVGTVWHHRLADLAAYAAGALNLRANELVGLADVCDALGVTNKDPHSAMGDAHATAECFRILAKHYSSIEPFVPSAQAVSA